MAHACYKYMRSSRVVVVVGVTASPAIVRDCMTTQTTLLSADTK